MKVVYNKNPLRSETVLNEVERKELWYKTKIEEMHDTIFEAHFYLEEAHFNLQSAREVVDAKRLYGSKDKISEIDERTNEVHIGYLDALRDIHMGDCTCCPSSCIKCHAESMIGIDTIKGLSNHAGHYIEAAFNKYGTLEMALDYLKNYEPKADWKGWEAHADRWRQEARQAYEWLVKYRDEHFPLV